MASRIAPGRVITLARDPYLWLADGLTGTGLRWWLALLTIPLWLTPSRYSTYLRPGSAGSGRAALWAAAHLWFGTMMLMSLPFASLLQAPLARLGHQLGYWDDLFAAPLVMLLVTAISFSFLAAVAAAEWSMIWIACGVDRLFGGGTIVPPPLGYAMTRIAGATAGIALATSILVFSIKPVNDPLWRWLDHGGVAPFLIILGGSAALMVGFNRKTRVTQICEREIFGGGGKALVYRLGSIIAPLAAVWLLAGRHHL